MASLTDTRSAELYRRALELLPGGVNSPVRAMSAIGRDPIFVDRGEGAELIDVDGNRFVDYVCSWGPLIHGHAHPEVLAAVRARRRRGHELRRADAGRGRAGGRGGRARVDARRDAAHDLLGHGGRDDGDPPGARGDRARARSLKFAGAYHGHLDALLAQAGSGLATQALPASPGVPRSATAGTVVVAWNDAEALRAACERHEPAAILAEPLPANMGLVPPRDGLPRAAARAWPTPAGALLVLDEVISGFRVARGGAQELTGVSADLTIMGKVIGGGLPAAALGGRGRADADAGARPATSTRRARCRATRSRWPPGWRRWSCSTRPRTRGWRRRTERLAAGLREAAGAGDPASRSLSAPGLLTVFFSERRGRATSRTRRPATCEAYARLVPRAALARRVPAAVAVRGVVPLAGAHARSRSSARCEAATAAFAAVRGAGERARESHGGAADAVAASARGRARRACASCCARRAG